MSSPPHADILLIEDDPGDVLITREALAASHAPIVLHVVHDGEQGMDFLARRGAHASAVRPDLILLDLNLPRFDGRRVLEAAKSDPQTASIPVVVLTTSSAQHDVTDCYARGANAYLAKPLELDGYLSAVRAVADFFLGAARLPGRSSPRAAACAPTVESDMSYVDGEETRS